VHIETGGQATIEINGGRQPGRSQGPERQTQGAQDKTRDIGSRHEHGRLNETCRANVEGEKPRKLRIEVLPRLDGPLRAKTVEPARSPIGHEGGVDDIDAKRHLNPRTPGLR